MEASADERNLPLTLAATLGVCPRCWVRFPNSVAGQRCPKDDAFLVSEASVEASFGEPFLGAQVGRFGLLRVLGRGAQSIVFEGIDRDSVRCAVKLVRLDPLQELPEPSALIAARLENEARVLDRLADVPGVPRRLEFVRSQGGGLPAHVALAMSFAAGAPVSDEVSEAALLSWSKTLLLAHRRGFVHCDLAPQHLLLAADGTTHILDWGCALELGSAESPRGFHPSYASDQLLAGRPADTHFDWFALKRIVETRVESARASAQVMGLIATLATANSTERRLRAEEALSEVCGLSAVR